MVVQNSVSFSVSYYGHRVDTSPLTIERMESMEGGAG
jgi:hypothetical protein